MKKLILCLLSVLVLAAGYQAEEKQDVAPLVIEVVHHPSDGKCKEYQPDKGKLQRSCYTYDHWKMKINGKEYAEGGMCEIKVGDPIILEAKGEFATYKCYYVKPE